MQFRYTQFLAALSQAQGFLDTNGTVLGAINQGGARRALDDCTAALAHLAATHEVQRMRQAAEVQSEHQLARRLRRRYLRPISLIARAHVRDVPEFERMTSVPHKENAMETISRARAVAERIVGHEALFVDRGFEPGFLSSIEAATASLARAVATKGESRSNRVKTTVAIFEEVRKARQAVTILDAFVRGAISDTEPVLAGWKNACRVIRATQRTGGSSATTAVAAERMPIPEAA
jgi:hypothetical protein